MLCQIIPTHSQNISDILTYIRWSQCNHSTQEENQNSNENSKNFGKPENLKIIEEKNAQ